MKLKLLVLALCLSCSVPLAGAQAPQSQAAEPEDEVVAIGTARTDPAMSAYLSGDFETA